MDKASTIQRLLNVRKDAIISQADQDALGLARVDLQTVGQALHEVIAWSARCCCYAGGSGHSTNSGRCGARDIWDSNRKPGEAAVCSDCREHCK